MWKCDSTPGYTQYPLVFLRNYNFGYFPPKISKSPQPIPNCPKHIPKQSRQRATKCLGRAWDRTRYRPDPTPGPVRGPAHWANLVTRKRVFGHIFTKISKPSPTYPKLSQKDPKTFTNMSNKCPTNVVKYPTRSHTKSENVTNISNKNI